MRVVRTSNIIGKVPKLLGKRGQDFILVIDIVCD
jgi:hypothetical protein